jgi:uncharacterized RDD family membrane protein YckC
VETLEIRTPHNVSLSLRLTGVMSRVVAFGMDQFFLYAFLLLYFYSLYALPRWQNYEVGEVIIPAVGISIYLFYSLLFETFWNGQTPGKRIVGIRVRREDGGAPVFMDYLIRWIFRIPDIAISAGMLAVMLISASSKRQRLGDLLAGTVVVQEDRHVAAPLKQILSIKNQEAYSPMYPTVARLKEQHIVTIKELVTRSREMPTPVYSKLVSDTAKRMAHLLEIEEVPENAGDFLKDLVREYVILTR